MYKRPTQSTNDPPVLYPHRQLLTSTIMPRISSSLSRVSSRSSRRTPSPTDSIIEDLMQWSVSVNDARRIRNIRTAEGLFKLGTGAAPHTDTPFPCEEDIITADQCSATSVSPLPVYPLLPPSPPAYQSQSPSYHPRSPTPNPVVPAAPAASRQTTLELVVPPVPSRLPTPDIKVPRQPSPELPEVPLIIATPRPMPGVQPHGWIDNEDCAQPIDFPIPLCNGDHLVNGSMNAPFIQFA
jgi:hypothetical protein